MKLHEGHFPLTVLELIRVPQIVFCCFKLVHKHHIEDQCKPVTFNLFLQFSTRKFIFMSLPVKLLRPMGAVQGACLLQTLIK